jgi:hypothetical protein
MMNVFNPRYKPNGSIRFGQWMDRMILDMVILKTKHADTEYISSSSANSAYIDGAMRGS